VTVSIAATPTVVEAGGRGALIDNISLDTQSGLVAGNAVSGTKTDITLANYITTGANNYGKYSNPSVDSAFDKITGAEFLRFVAALYNAEDATLERRIDELLDLFELAPWKHQLTESYSHGMRQKLIIASAFVHRPEVIVVDEPMVGLDPKGARLLKDMFRRYVDRGGTILMSTHTLEVAESMCDRIAIMQAGRILAQGTMAELREQTASGDSSLEDLFLRLTGGFRDHQLDTILGA